MRGVGEAGSSPVKAPVAILVLPLFLLVVGIGDGVRYGSARAHPYQGYYSLILFQMNKTFVATRYSGMKIGA